MLYVVCVLKKDIYGQFYTILMMIRSDIEIDLYENYIRPGIMGGISQPHVIDKKNTTDHKRTV